MNRWWSHWDSLPWPDAQGFWLATCVTGHVITALHSIHFNLSTRASVLMLDRSCCVQDEKSNRVRATVMRYLNLSACYTKCLLNTRVRKRFPTLEHFVEAGQITYYTYNHTYILVLNSEYVAH
jgi:hypothetical protein